MNKSEITPAQALTLLKEGNERFLAGRTCRTDLQKQRQDSEKAQYPFAAILGCIDSRTAAEFIFDQGIGELINVRVAGNIVNEDVLGSLEYSCAVLNARLILVLGHSACGAVRAACDDFRLGHLSGLLQKIKEAVETEKLKISGPADSTASFVDQVARRNIKLSIKNLREGSKILSELERNGKIAIMGAFYELGSGSVEFLED